MSPEMLAALRAASSALRSSAGPEEVQNAQRDIAELLARMEAGSVSEPIFTERDQQQSERSSLGPHYFASRRIVDAALAPLTSADAKEIAETVAKQIYDRIQEVAEESLWMDAEMNLQSKMWRMVDEIVKGILGGDRGAVERYALGERYRCEDVRKAIAAHFPQEIMAARIVDLEAENKRLQDALSREREYRR
jgi:hypothetical protein